MLYFSRLFKIKEGKLEKFQSWMEELSSSRKEEALATFSYEKVRREVFAILPTQSNEHYVVAFNEADEVPGKSDPSVLINQQNSAIRKDCLEAISDPGKILLDLSLPDQRK